MANPAPWDLRAARASDRDVVPALLREANLPTDGFLDRFPEGSSVAESGGHVIARAGLERHGAFGLLRSMAVSPGWRGRGIGKALTGRLLDMAREKGLRAVYLLTTTAQAYFGGHGFAHVPRDEVPAEIRASVEFASACPASAACMSRRISPGGESPDPEGGAS